MAKYAVFASATGTAGSTIAYFANPATSPARMKMFEAIIGSQATPADQAVEYQVRRVTDEAATATGSAVTPFPLDEDEPAARSNAVEAPTDTEADSTDPTFAAGAALEIALNQRATFRWVAAPGSELICAATEDHGFGIESIATTSAHSANVTMLYEE